MRIFATCAAALRTSPSWVARLSEFLPAFRSQLAHVVVQPLQQFERVGMDFAFGMTPGRAGVEFALARAIENDLGHDRSRRIARAQKQHIEGTICHVAPHAVQQAEAGAGENDARMARAKACRVPEAAPVPSP
jgi:hypothetical protein